LRWFFALVLFALALVAQPGKFLGQAVPLISGALALIERVALG
jgi:hypothetical protein